jgi:hypothetical protein
MLAKTFHDFSKCRTSFFLGGGVDEITAHRVPSFCNPNVPLSVKSDPILREILEEKKN